MSNNNALNGSSLRNKQQQEFVPGSATSRPAKELNLKGLKVAAEHGQYSHEDPH